MTPDLPAPGELWARWAALSAALRCLGFDDVWWTGPDGAAGHDDGGGSWMRLTLVEGGRAVLHGWDRDASFDHDDVGRCAPPLDLLAGSPDWLPFAELRQPVAEEQLGWAFWFEPGTGWSRAAYPDGVGDGSATLLRSVREPDDGLAEVQDEWAEADVQAAPRARVLAAAAAGFVDAASLAALLAGSERAVPEVGAGPTTPTWAAPGDGRDRPSAPVMTREEQRLVAEAAARAGYEAPRRTPAPSPLLAEVAAPVVAAVPPGGRGSITAWLGEHSAKMTQHGDLDADRLDVLRPLRELRRAEGTERGRWSFFAVVVRDGEVSFWRAYDTVPTWWTRERYSSPDLPEAVELAARPPGFRPAWAELLEDPVRASGVPPRFAGLARRVLGRDVVAGS